jgi:hypothetical protein
MLIKYQLIIIIIFLNLFSIGLPFSLKRIAFLFVHHAFYINTIADLYCLGRFYKRSSDFMYGSELK